MEPTFIYIKLDLSTYWYHDLFEKKDENDIVWGNGWIN